MRVWRDPLWRRAPIALTRFGGVLAGVVAGTALLSLAAASNPFFISASASSALSSEIEDVTRYGAGATVALTDAPFRAGIQTWTPRDRALDRAVRDIEGLDRRVTTLLGPEIDGAGPGGATLRVRLLARTEALTHVRKLNEVEGSGVWLPDTAAEGLGLAAGGEIRLGLGTTRDTAATRVKGIYRALKSEPPSPYWRSLDQDIYPRPPIYAETAPFVIADETTLKALAGALGIERFFFRWEFPLEDSHLTVPEAERLRADLAGLQRSLLTPDASLGETFACRSCFLRRTEYSSQLSTAVANARETAATVRGPIDLLSNAGSLVALAVVAAAAGFAFARRRVEATLLYSQGESPSRFGARLALESLLPAVAGALLGVGLALLLVQALGPGRVAGPALRDGAVAAGWRLPAALVLFGLVAAREFARRLGEGSRRHRRVHSLPWELPVLALAAFFLYRLLTGSGVSVDEGAVPRPSFYLLLFPIAFIAGTAGLASRGLLRALRAFRDRGAGSPDAVYLATHRLAASGGLAILLVTAAAVAIGVFVYAQAVVSSYKETIRAASHLSTGSDVQGQVSFDREAPEDVSFPVTKATRAYNVGSAEPSGEQIDLLAVDPDTLERAVHWEEGYASRPLGEIVSELEHDGNELPVVLVGTDPENVRAIEIEGRRIPLRIVEQAKAFPGMSRNGPMVVAATSGIDRRFEDSVRDPLREATYSEIWAKGPTAETARHLAASEARPYPVVTAEEARDRPEVVAFTRTFAFLEALGLAAGALAAVGMVLYLQTRQRGRVVSYGLARRMGLSRGSHRVALALELVGALLAALALGFPLALAAARVVVGEVEPLASISPVPLFDAPLLVAVPALLAVAGVAVAGAAAADRAAARGNLAEAMRLGD